MNEISTTPEIETRRDKIKDQDIEPENWNPEVMDIEKDYSEYREDGEHHKEGGYKRLLESNFVKNQARWLRRKILRNPFQKHRFIVPLPDNRSDYDVLRSALLDVQSKSNQMEEEKYVPAHRSESAQGVIDFISRVDENVSLVIDARMFSDEMETLLEWALPEEVSEIVVMNHPWEDTSDNFRRMIKHSRQHPDKFHLYGAYWDVHEAGDGVSPLYLLLLANGFKSVSFQDAPIPGYILPYIRDNPPRSAKEQLDTSMWMNSETMEAESWSPDLVTCFGEDYQTRETMTELVKKTDIKSCIGFHNVETLAPALHSLKTSEKEKERVLGLDSVKPVAAQLGI